jgi:hypothetical protein
MLPLANKGDKFYLVSKQGESYYTYAYQVTKKEIVEPDQVDVLRQDVKGNIATLITCYPIGTLEKRVVVEAEPVTNIIDQTMVEMLNSLTVTQQVKLREIAQSTFEQYQTDNTPLELVILKLQSARDDLVTRTDLTDEQKQERDTIRQFLIYQYVNQ